jgi:hypothetical protein
MRLVSVSSFSHSPKELLSSAQTLGSIWFSGQPLNLFQDSIWFGPQHFIFTQGSALVQPSNLEFDSRLSFRGYGLISFGSASIANSNSVLGRHFST